MSIVDYIRPLPTEPADGPTTTVAVVGLGYVGLPTALSLATADAHVIGVDISARRITAIHERAVDLSASDLARLDLALSSETLRTTCDPAAQAEADNIVICVPTPVDEHLTPDLTALRGACEMVVANARLGQRVVLTSTTYVGCTQELLVEPLEARGLVVGRDVFVAFSPERINPGVESTSPEATPRVIGGATEACLVECSAFLRPTCAGLHPVSSLAAAEMTKLLENTFRAVNIAFVNEMADVAALEGVSISEVIDAAATKPYGFMRFTPGAGVGGHCIPCDPHYLLWRGRERAHYSPVVESAMTAIARRPRQVVERARELLADGGRGIAGSRVHVWGVSYKPGVADLRESPALAIIGELARLGAEVTYSDPMIELAGGTEIVGDVAEAVPASAASDAHLVVVVTRHPGDDLAPLAAAPAVLDTTYSLSAVLPTCREL